jgi:hypothetical protein
MANDSNKSWYTKNKSKNPSFIVYRDLQTLAVVVVGLERYSSSPILQATRRYFLDQK